MFKQSPRRNQKNKGFKVKHVVQLCLLVGVCVWLLYQVQHSRGRLIKASYQEDAKISDNVPIKLGRKDLLEPEVDEDKAENEQQKEEVDHFDDENPITGEGVGDGENSVKETEEGVENETSEQMESNDNDIRKQQDEDNESDDRKINDESNVEGNKENGNMDQDIEEDDAKIEQVVHAEKDGENAAKNGEETFEENKNLSEQAKEENENRREEEAERGEKENEESNEGNERKENDSKENASDKGSGTVDAKVEGNSILGEHNEDSSGAKEENERKEIESEDIKEENERKENESEETKEDNRRKESENEETKEGNDRKENERENTKEENVGKESQSEEMKAENDRKENEREDTKLENVVKESQSEVMKAENDRKENESEETKVNQRKESESEEIKEENERNESQSEEKKEDNQRKESKSEETKEENERKETESEATKKDNKESESEETREDNERRESESAETKEENKRKESESDDIKEKNESEESKVWNDSKENASEEGSQTIDGKVEERSTLVDGRNEDSSGANIHDETYKRKEEGSSKGENFSAQISADNQNDLVNSNMEELGKNEQNQKRDNFKDSGMQNVLNSDDSTGGSIYSSARVDEHLEIQNGNGSSAETSSDNGKHHQEKIRKVQTEKIDTGTEQSDLKSIASSTAENLEMSNVESKASIDTTVHAAENEQSAGSEDIKGIKTYPETSAEEKSSNSIAQQNLDSGSEQDGKTTSNTNSNGTQQDQNISENSLNTSESHIKDASVLALETVSETGKHDEVDSSTSSIPQEEKEARTDLDTLPELEASNHDADAIA